MSLVSSQVTIELDFDIEFDFLPRREASLRLNASEPPEPESRELLRAWLVDKHGKRVWRLTPEFMAAAPGVLEALINEMHKLDQDSFT